MAAPFSCSHHSAAISTLQEFSFSCSTIYTIPPVNCNVPQQQCSLCFSQTFKHLLVMAVLLSSPTFYTLLVCIIIIFFTRADQVKGSHDATPAIVVARKVLQSQLFIVAPPAGRVLEQRVEGRATQAVDMQMRMVPSGPNPLHHHREAPKRPQTP